MEKLNHQYKSGVGTYHLVLLLTTYLSGPACADSTQTLGKALEPFEGLLTKGCIGLLILFVGLIAWEVIENKRTSRSSLDIAKLAAAAAKKKTSAVAPASGSLEAPASRSFAPPPPPPPPASEPSSRAASGSGRSSPPPPPPPADNPFASPLGAHESLGGVQPVDSTVAFTPPDSASSGGWADLLQRVRAGEPEAASFSETSPAPSTEEEAAAAASAFAAQNALPTEAPAPQGMDFSSSSMAAPAAEPSASSEAWEALLKRTTGPESPLDAPPSQDSGRISLGSSFAPPAPPPAPDFPSAEQAPPAFSLPKPAGSGGFALPPSGGSDAPTSSFSMPSAAASDAPTSSFSIPQAPASETVSGGPPSFKLPGGQSAPGGGGFQVPGQSSGPFGGGIDDPSSTLPLSDMFSPQPGGAPPSFQLPSMGQQPSLGNQPSMGAGFDAPFDFGGGDGAGRTISLDFSQGTGQIPPPPQPKTEG
jgi:nicotinate-nucleotide--dimethylbenzimidazole phosphoribosyltransferase